MATVTGPLHSDQARGQFGKTTIYQQRGAKSIVKHYAAPKEPNSADQLAVQAETKYLSQLWTTLTPEQQASWDLLAAETGVEPINAFMATNWARFKQNLEPLLSATTDLTNAILVTEGGDYLAVDAGGDPLNWE